MPGPGGGANSGGFGGGSRGGGFGGGHGGFGGHHGPHHHHHHYPYFRRRFFFPFFGGPMFFYYGGGGFFGGFLSLFLLPIILLIFIVSILSVLVVSTISSISRGGDIVYNEETFQDYAYAEYAKVFENDKSYEDNILIVFLTYEDYNGYECICMNGNNLSKSVDNLFGNENTTFGRAMLSSISQDNYKYQLTKGFTSVMSYMTDYTPAGNSFIIAPDYENTNESKLVNYTDLNIDETYVNASLEAFTDKTDVPICIVVTTGESMFGKTMPVGEIIISVILLIGLGFVIYWIIKAIKFRKNGGQNGGGQPRNEFENYGGNTNGYGNYNNTGNYR